MGSQQQVRIVAEGQRGTSALHLDQNGNIYRFSSGGSGSILALPPEKLDRITDLEHHTLLEDPIPRDYRSFLGSFDPTHPKSEELEKRCLALSNKEKKTRHHRQRRTPREKILLRQRYGTLHTSKRRHRMGLCLQQPPPLQ